MQKELAEVIYKIDNNSFFAHWDSLVNREVLKQLPLDYWFKIIKQRPKWWIFRGPFCKEAYKEEYREQMIQFLMENPTIADVYLHARTDEFMGDHYGFKPVRENLLNDPRIAALYVMFI